MDSTNPQSDNLDRGPNQAVFEQAVEVLSGRKKGEPTEGSVFDTTGQPIDTPPAEKRDGTPDQDTGSPRG